MILNGTEKLRSEGQGLELESGGAITAVNRLATESTSVETTPLARGQTIVPTLLKLTDITLQKAVFYIENITAITLKELLKKIDYLDDPSVWSSVLKIISGEKPQTGSAAA